MSDWKEYRLGDVTEWASGGTPSKKNENFWNGNIPWISASSMSGNRYSDSKLKITEAGLKSGSRLADKDSILLLVRGSTLHQRILVGIAERDVAFNQDVKSIKPKEAYLDSWYLLFWFMSIEKELLNMVENTGIGAGKLDTKLLQNLIIKIPPKDERERIKACAKAIDDKLILNYQTNQTLEYIAQTIFKSWFVDFEPVKAKIKAKQNDQDPELAAMSAISGKTEEQLKGLDKATLQQLKTTASLFPDALVESELGEMPAGWNVSELGELLEFNPKRTLKKGTLAPYLDMKNVPTQGHLAVDVYLREMTSGTKFINGDTLLARITPCLENGKTAYVDFLEEEQVGWGSTEYIIMRPRNGLPMSLGYMIARLDSFRSKAIQTMTGTSGRQRANARALSELSWINYPISLLKVYDFVAGSYLDKAKNIGNENKTLTELRDLLLPKLLTGAIGSCNTEHNTEAVV